MAARLPGIARLGAAMAWHADRRAASGLAACQIVSGAATGLVLVAANGVLARLLTAGATPGRLEAALPALILVGICLTAVAVCSAASTAMSGRLSARIDTAAEHRLLAAVVAVDVSRYDDPSWNDDRMAAETASKEAHVVVTAGSQVAYSFFAILFSAAVLGRLHPLLLALLPAVVIPKAWASLAAARVKHAADTALLDDRRARHSIIYHIAGADAAAEIRTGRLAGWLLGKFTDLSARLEDTAAAASRSAAGLALVGAAVSAVGTGILYSALLWLTFRGTIPLSAAGTAYFGIRMIGTVLTSAAGNVAKLYELSLYLGDYDDFLKDCARSAYAKPTDRAAAPCDAVELRATGVTFSYPGSAAPALLDVDVRCRPGQITALVGANGAGKSTLAKILAGLYAPQAGIVTWADDDLAATGPDWAWSNLAYVPQSFTRWPFTLRENIALGRPVSAEEIQAAAAAARAADFIGELPEGMDTSLAGGWWGGRSVSGGQWQRLALARAYLAAGAPVLIADEPTAALDPLAELAALDHLVELAAGRTVLLVTHRLGICPKADWIVVVDGGRVVQEGTHESLLLLDGHYRTMFTAQASAYVNEPNCI